MYALTAIDRASRIAYAKVFSKLNSQISTEFLKEVIKESHRIFKRSNKRESV